MGASKNFYSYVFELAHFLAPFHLRQNVYLVSQAKLSCVKVWLESLAAAPHCTTLHLHLPQNNYSHLLHLWSHIVNHAPAILNFINMCEVTAAYTNLNLVNQ